MNRGINPRPRPGEDCTFSRHASPGRCWCHVQWDPFETLVIPAKAGIQSVGGPCGDSIGNMGERKVAESSNNRAR
jgi:hypothetical protein